MIKQLIACIPQGGAVIIKIEHADGGLVRASFYPDGKDDVRPKFENVAFEGTAEELDDGKDLEFGTPIPQEPEPIDPGPTDGPNSAIEIPTHPPVAPEPVKRKRGRPPKINPVEPLPEPSTEPVEPQPPPKEDRLAMLRRKLAEIEG
jgi:hypothetical protein